MANVSKISDGTTTYDISSITVKNQNSLGNSLKMWTGTKAQYDAIVTKDNNTLYNITDDTDLSLSILATLYPVGAIYIGTMDTCPLSVLGLGTWVKVSEGRVLQGSDSGHNAGTTIEAGLPNITGGTNVTLVSFYGTSGGTTGTGAFSKSGQTYTEVQPANGTSGSFFYMNFDASDSNSIYGNSTTVQPPAFIVNIWKRTA
jgi:hypothetical protein